MILYPNNAKVPDWVEQLLNTFNTTLKSVNTGTTPKDKILETLEQLLPKNVKITKALTKSEVGKLLNKMAEQTTDEEFMWYYYILLNAGFILSSQYPSSLDNNSFNIPKEFITKRNLFVKEYNDGKLTIVQLDKSFNNLTQEILNYFEANNVSVANIINSGAAGSLGSLRQMVVGLGITVNGKKEVIDVIGSGLSEGQSQTEFFNQASHAIQALYSKSADTAIPGYAGRKLSTIMEHIKLAKTPDCGSRKGLKIKIVNDKLQEVVQGKFLIVPQTILNRAGIEEITEKTNLIGKTVELRSPLYCKAKDGICMTCLNKQYVDNLDLRPGANIGLMSSTFITNILVNTTLKKSHTGILLGKQKINLLKELEDIYE